MRRRSGSEFIVFNLNPRLCLGVKLLAMPLTRLKDEYLEQDCVQFLMKDEAQCGA